MEIALSVGFIGVSAAVWRWRNLDRAGIAERMAHRLLAYAAGKRAQRAAVAEAMGKRVVMEDRHATTNS